jgi:dTDP-glucose 4,6-dehydratase
MLKNKPGVSIVNLDKMTYAGLSENVADIESDPRYRFIKADILDYLPVKDAMEGADVVVHFAAETHVDRSIIDPSDFVLTNVQGTYHLLEAAKQASVKRFIYISTEEVYGSLGTSGYFTESSPLLPNSPYSASKAGADSLSRAYHKTYGLPVIITRCSNNYGSCQYPEKLIPLMIKRALSNEKLPVYGDGDHVRDWIFVEDHCEALLRIIEGGKIGEVYNIGSRNERKNIDLVKMILKMMGKPESLISFVEDRPGHDQRYAIDASKIEKELGWKPRISFEEGLRRTVEWYVKKWTD